MIRKGSRQVVGTAELIKSLPPIASIEEFTRTEPQHRIPPTRQERAFLDGWRTPWILRNARTLAAPIPYEHQSGAVIWVSLDLGIENAIELQESGIPPSGRSASLQIEQSIPLPGTVRLVQVTGGNLRNNHIYLPLDFFPQDVLGGKNQSESAERAISVKFFSGQTIETDIDKTKRILRVRGAVGDFFARASVLEGDTLRITKLGPYRYQISKETS